MSQAVRSLRSVPSMRRMLHTSSTAPKPSHLLSSQRDTTRSHFANLTVPVLKDECRSRGLKLSGKKSDLIERIVGFEHAKLFTTSSAADSPAKSLKAPPKTPEGAAARAFSSTSKVEAPMAAPKAPKAALKSAPKAAAAGAAPLEDARAFSSSTAAAAPELIDYTLPKAPKTAEHVPVVYKIPVSHEKVAPAAPKKSLAADTGASAGDVFVVHGSGYDVSHMNVDLGSGHTAEEEERLGHKPTYPLPEKDKPFLLGLAAIIAAWWGSKYVSSDE